MVKRILLISLFLPVLAHGETMFIGSSESLTERNLPLIESALDDAYRTQLADHDCFSKHSLYNRFIEGKMSVPFSAKELLKLCRKEVIGYYQDEYSVDKSTACKNKLCAHFVVDYVDRVSKATPNNEGLRFDMNVMAGAVREYETRYNDCADSMIAGDFLSYVQEKIIRGEVSSFLKPVELLDFCQDHLGKNNAPADCISKCSILVTEYENMIK